MTAPELVDVLGNIEDGMIIALCSRIYTKRRKSERNFRRTLRVLIAAAAVISALGLTAYAVSSLHQRRQEELRERYNVMSVPCLVIDNGAQVTFGKKNIRQLLEYLK